MLIVSDEVADMREVHSEKKQDEFRSSASVKLASAVMVVAS